MAEVRKQEPRVQLYDATDVRYSRLEHSNIDVPRFEIVRSMDLYDWDICVAFVSRALHLPR